jgi:hypothetical protein
MPEIALYARQDGLFEPRSEKGRKYTSDHAGSMFILHVTDSPRTALQNRFLNGFIYVKQICNKLNEAGIKSPCGPWTRDILHAAMQECFLIKEEYLMKGKHIKVYESTADMSRKRFTEYCKQVSEFAHEMWGITVEDPNKDDGIFYEMWSQIRK